MRAISILYHDVITGEAADSSGLPGRGAAAYKLPRENFLRHLSAIAAPARCSLHVSARMR